MGGSCDKNGGRKKIDTRRWWKGVKVRKREDVTLVWVFKPWDKAT